MESRKWPFNYYVIPNGIMHSSLKAESKIIMGYLIGCSGVELKPVACGKETISQCTALALATVKKHLKMLQALNLISIEKGMTNVYAVNFKHELILKDIDFKEFKASKRKEKVSKPKRKDRCPIDKHQTKLSPPIQENSQTKLSPPDRTNSSPPVGLNLVHHQTKLSPHNIEVNREDREENREKELVPLVTYLSEQRQTELAFMDTTKLYEIMSSLNESEFKYVQKLIIGRNPIQGKQTFSAREY